MFLSTKKNDTHSELAFLLVQPTIHFELKNITSVIKRQRFVSCGRMRLFVRVSERKRQMKKKKKKRLMGKKPLRFYGLSRRFNGKTYSEMMFFFSEERRLDWRIFKRKLKREWADFIIFLHETNTETWIFRWIIKLIWTRIKKLLSQNFEDHYRLVQKYFWLWMLEWWKQLN